MTARHYRFDSKSVAFTIVSGQNIKILVGIQKDAFFGLLRDKDLSEKGLR